MQNIEQVVTAMEKMTDTQRECTAKVIEPLSKEGTAACKTVCSWIDSRAFTGMDPAAVLEYLDSISE